MSLGQSIRSGNTGMASTAVSAVTKAASEPLLTGGLLYLLTRGPPRLRARLLAPFQSTLPLFSNTPKGIARITTFITLLKILTTAGVLRRINQALNRLAWNNWTLGRNGAEWAFGPAKQELVLITGGSSGFGYEMVKSFSKHARVIVIDVSSFPAELDALPDVHFYQCDITDTSALEAMCAQIKKEHGTVSVLINNAGIGIGKSLLEVRGPLHTCRSVLTRYRQVTQKARSCCKSTSSRTWYSSASSFPACLRKRKDISFPSPPWRRSLPLLD